MNSQQTKAKLQQKERNVRGGRYSIMKNTDKTEKTNNFDET
jgi:hypothetical protein